MRWQKSPVPSDSPPFDRHLPYVEPWPIGGFSDLSTFKSVLLAFFIAFFSFFIFLSIFDLSFFLPMALLRSTHPTVDPNVRTHERVATWRRIIQVRESLPLRRVDPPCRG